jgi:hypothetical protein
MRPVSQRIEDLDIGLFDAIPSQTSADTRRSLLAVHRATARRRRDIVYLEIGSHLGGSLQPYLLDPRCRAIFSIDPRPPAQKDDRSPGFVAAYEDNSTARMLALLREIAPAEVGKVRCFDTDASQVDLALVKPRPDVAFIDGEHTRRAVLSDSTFVRRVLADGGTIVFDDFSIVYPAVLEVCAALRKEKRRFLPVRLAGRAFALFFDPDLAKGDPFVERCRRRRRLTLPRYRLKLLGKSLLPGPAGRLARSLRKPRREGRR